MGPRHECTTNQSGRLMKLRGYGSRRFMFGTRCLAGWQDLKTTYNPATPPTHSFTHRRIVNPPSNRQPTIESSNQRPSPSPQGFEILLIDEHLTPSCCPLCRITTSMANKWPPRRSHWTLKCVSPKYQATLGGRERLWNDDLVATMNFLASLHGYRGIGWII
jgi:hypothetical protein